MVERIQDCIIRIRYEEHVPLRKGIRKLQRELKISVSEFPQFGLIDRITAEEEEQNLSDRSHTKTHNELQEQNQDPYRIERVPDLRKEQKRLQTNSSGMDRHWIL